MLIVPLATFAVAVSTVPRTRRASGNTAMLGVLVTFAVTMLVAWGMTRRTSAFVASYVYLTTNIAYSGPINYQNFEIDIVLRVDHLTAAALLVVELCILGVLAWHRIMGRNEPGPARFQALLSVFLFACMGTLLSNDLAELFTFWAIAGGVTYLMLAHRWGVDEAARAGRVALALPFLTDLFFLCGIATLYSRYGKQNLADLIPILHTTAGWTVRQLIVASVLLFVGIAGRLALWPLHMWLSSTASSAPPAASAIAQAVWPVLAITVLYRLAPILAASNVQTMRALLIASGVVAVIAPAVSLAHREPRTVLILVGSGLSAVGAAVVIRGFEYHGFTFAIAGVACILAAAPARGAGSLAASVIANAMRSEDMSEMGGAWRRMRASAAVLLVVSFAMGLSAIGALAIAVDSRTRFGVTLGDAVFLVAFASLRVFMAVGTGALRRRRAFDPDRVRDAPAESLGWPYWLVLASLALAVAAFVPGWLGYLDGARHPAARAAAYETWLSLALVGFAAAALTYVASREGALRASQWLNGMGALLVGRGSALLGRFVLTPSARIVDRTGELVPSSDAAVGRISLLSGRFAAFAALAPATPVLLVIAVLLAGLVALLSPAVLR